MSAELELSRRRLERGLDELLGAVESEIGWAPRLGRWAALVVAAAAGFAVASAIRSRRRLRDRQRDGR